MKNLSTKLPEKLYCGFQKRTPEELLGFITPFGTDTAFQKRKYTVDQWARSTRSKETIESKIFDNVLLDGYRLDRHIKRYGWNGGNVVVRIEDPRGFEAEISVANLCKILENNTVVNGLIKAKCIWGRDGAQNILLAENSQPYLEAIQNTERQKKSISVWDIRPGNTILLKNGKTVVYHGKGYDVIFREMNEPWWGPKEIIIDYDRRMRHLYSVVNEDGLPNQSIQSTSVLKISEILDSWEYESEQDRRDTITKINQLSLDQNKAYIFDKNQQVSFVLEKASNFDSLSRSITGVSVIRDKSTGVDSFLYSFYFRYLDSCENKDVRLSSQLGIGTISPKKILFMGKWIESSRNWMRYSHKPYFEHKKETLPSTLAELKERFDLFRITYVIDQENPQDSQ